MEFSLKRNLVPSEISVFNNELVNFISMYGKHTCLVWYWHNAQTTHLVRQS